MSIPTILAIYFILWWVVLFAVLPWGVRSQQESGDVAPGTEPGAPATHLLWRKLVWTTITAAVIFAFFAALYRMNWLPLDFLTRISNPPHS